MMLPFLRNYHENCGNRRFVNTPKLLQLLFQMP